MHLKIPNIEVKSIYKRTIMTWFDKVVQKKNLQSLFTAFFTGDTDTIQKELILLLIESISFYDYAENFYQGFLMGIFNCMPECIPTSNRESGIGRYDIQVKNPNITKPSLLIEIKATKIYSELDTLAEKALEQIHVNQYEMELIRNGHYNIIKYGISFQGKQCRVTCCGNVILNN